MQTVVNFHDPLHESALINLLSMKLLSALLYARDPRFNMSLVILVLLSYCKKPLRGMTVFSTCFTTVTV